MRITTHAKLRPAYQRRALAVLGVALAATLGACDVHVATAPGSLPTLSGVDALRDQAVRTETAIVARALQLNARADSCPDCQQALDGVAEGASTRIEALGGMWQPWDLGAPSDVETPEEVADAPLNPTDFAAWMQQTALEDLQQVAAETDASGEEAATLAALAAGRIASAEQLASTYEATLPQYQQDFSGDTKGADDAGADAAEDATRTVDTSALAQSDVLARAVTVWDCAAQTYPQSQAVDEVIVDATLPADRLLTRVSEVLSLGVEDQRQLHCSLVSTDPVDLAFDLLEADLNVLTSEEPAVRAIGALYVAQDAQTLAETLENGQIPAIPGIAGVGESN